MGTLNPAEFKFPDGMNCTERRVVRLEGQVCRPAKMRWDRAAKEKCPDTKPDTLGCILIEGEQYQRAMVIEAIEARDRE